MAFIRSQSRPSDGFIAFVHHPEEALHRFGPHCLNKPTSGFGDPGNLQRVAAAGSWKSRRSRLGARLVGWKCCTSRIDTGDFIDLLPDVADLISGWMRLIMLSVVSIDEYLH